MKYEKASIVEVVTGVIKRVFLSDVFMVVMGVSLFVLTYIMLAMIWP